MKCKKGIPYKEYKRGKKSRFSGGLVVDIQKPDYELRKKIVSKKIEEFNNLYSDEVKITKEIEDVTLVEIIVSR